MHLNAEIEEEIYFWLQNVRDESAHEMIKCYLPKQFLCIIRPAMALIILRLAADDFQDLTQNTICLYVQKHIEGS
jgi:hypothetical protein